MKNKKRVWIVLTILWTMVIFAFTLQPGNTSSNLSGSVLTEILGWFAPDILSNPEKLNLWHSVFRKCAHFTEYFVLGILSSNAFGAYKEKCNVWFSILFCILIASLDETIQLFVPGRAGRVTDVLIDGAGAVCAVFIIFVKKILKKNNSLDCVGNIRHNTKVNEK